jgi:hypothetical protein
MATYAIEWLLQSDEPWPRYRTLVDLLDRVQQEADAPKARSEMLEHLKVQELIAEAGNWTGCALKRHNDASHLVHMRSTLAHVPCAEGPEAGRNGRLAPIAPSAVHALVRRNGAGTSPGVGRGRFAGFQHFLRADMTFPARLSVRELMVSRSRTSTERSVMNSPMARACERIASIAGESSASKARIQGHQLADGLPSECYLPSAGSSTVKVVPWPTALSTSTRPP